MWEATHYSPHRPDCRLTAEPKPSSRSATDAHIAHSERTADVFVRVLVAGQADTCGDNKVSLSSECKISGRMKRLFQSISLFTKSNVEMMSSPVFENQMHNTHCIQTVDKMRRKRNTTKRCCTGEQTARSGVHPWVVAPNDGNI